jgi:uncharacterized membrane protein YdjX (TVP38/TMEM64 family)
MMNLVKRNWKFIIFLAIIGILIFSPLKDMVDLNDSIDFINKNKERPSAPFLYLLVYILGVVLAVPGIALTAIAGPLFGFWKGSLLVIIGSNAGCQITFFLSRSLGRDFIKKFIKSDTTADRIYHKIENNGFLVMLYLRLLPIFPFNGINYISGLTTIKHSHYTLATFVGMLPGTFVYVYVSTAATDARNNPVGLIVSIAVLIAFTVIISLLKRRIK